MFIRTAMAADLPAIHDLLVETWHDAYDAVFGRDKVTAITGEWHSVTALRRRLDRPHSEFIVADDGATIAGMAFAAAGADGKVLTLHQLYVRPAFQRGGIGGLLMDEILNAFPDAETCILEVAEGNSRAIAFYQSYDFAVAGGPEGELRHLRMERSLGVDAD
ncbi:MAG: GNAT family N-acetyltransferase [Phyllobacteriaceae bacterium]|nr:GNAT family N-acetyltransferase [Phyllobacteriaceae bacterium]